MVALGKGGELGDMEDEAGFKAVKGDGDGLFAFIFSCCGLYVSVCVCVSL